MLGKKFHIPDCFYHSESSGKFPSHESICVLNTSSEDAHLSITLFFEDREKRSGFEVVVKKERNVHIRMDSLHDKDGQGIETDVPYAAVIESSVPISVQYSRMDTSSVAMALMTAIIPSA